MVIDTSGKPPKWVCMTPSVRAAGPSYLKSVLQRAKPPLRASVPKPVLSAVEACLRASQTFHASRPPLVVVRTVADRQVIVDVSPEATALHVRCGMTLTEARSLYVKLPFVEQDLLRDEKTLEALGRWMMRFSPVVALSGTGGSPVSLNERKRHGRAAHATEEHHALFLDLTGCERLFGGLDNIMNQARRALAFMNITARLAIAPTPGAAWALASAGDEDGLVVEDEQEIEDFLAPLPPIALRIEDDVADALHHLGLETIGQVLQLPREALPARFGHALGMRIDQALGRIPEPLVPLEHVEEITAKMEFDGTIDSLEAIWAVFNDLLPRVLTQLERRGHGLRRLDVDFLQHYAPPVRRSIELSRPSRDPVNVFNLFRTAIEGGWEDKGTGRLGDKGKGKRRFSSVSLSPCHQVPLSSPSGLRLTVSVHERMTDEQVRLLDGETYAGQLELERLVERLRARVGNDSVVRPRLFESYVPERAWKEEDKGTGRQGDKETKNRRTGTPSASSPCPLVSLSPCLPPRPLHLFPTPREICVLAEPSGYVEGRPRQFSYAGQVHQLSAAVGPERIAGEWWRGHDKTRDYYDVADEAGNRFWVFRVTTRWKVRHPDGEEDRASTRWFWHGVFE